MRLPGAPRCGPAEECQLGAGGFAVRIATDLQFPLMKEASAEEHMGRDRKASNEELLREAQRGCESAFAELCGRYEASLKALIGRHIAGPLRRKLSVIDLLQDTFLAAHQGIPNFENRGERAFGAWMAGIAELKAKEAVRRYLGTQKRNVAQEVTRGQRPDTARFEGQGPSPSEMAIADERHEAVFAAMASLPDDYRRVLQLVQMEQVPMETAANLMGRTREAVRKLYGRALARLADLLDVDREV